MPHYPALHHRRLIRSRLFGKGRSSVVLLRLGDILDIFPDGFLGFSRVFQGFACLVLLRLGDVLA